MTACTPKEELEWKARLTRPARDEQEARPPNMFSSLHMNIKSLGTVFGKPGTFSRFSRCTSISCSDLDQGTLARRISIQRATTVGGIKSPLCQVILKNTNVLRDHGGNASATSAINRSQSLLTTTTRIPVLAPPRGERARLEALLSDVWSREILPFPRMTVKSRSENLVRSSASTVIRKLSVASFASSFTKRSASSTQKNQSSENIAMETIKRRDIRSPMDPTTYDDACTNEESGRKAKRRRTAKEHAATETCHGMKGVLRSIQRHEAPLRSDPANGVFTFPARTVSTSILLPARTTSSRALTPLPDTMDNATRPSMEKVRNLGRWTKMGGAKNDGAGGFRRLLSIGREA